MKIMLDAGAFMPEKAHTADAGWDLKSPIDIVLLPEESEVIHTGVHVQIPYGFAGILISKSGLNVKHGVTSTGLIDSGYTGEIAVKLYNHSRATYWVNAGDKISQLVVIPVVYDELEIVTELEETERGANGFGSSGR